MAAAVQASQEATFDQARADRFEERFVTALNHAALALMTSLGHRTGLFDAMAGQLPLTSEGIAKRAELQERYVREWLGAMVASGIVEMDPAEKRYSLPPEHASLLTRGGPANLAVFAQYIPMLGSIEEDVLTCFKQGGGVSYDRYERFHEVMAEDSSQTVLPALIDEIIPLMPELTARLESGIRVLDVGCGRGRALLLMAERFPHSRFVGYELSEQAIAWARGRSAQGGSCKS